MYLFSTIVPDLDWYKLHIFMIVEISPAHLNLAEYIQNLQAKLKRKKDNRKKKLILSKQKIPSIGHLVILDQ